MLLTSIRRLVSSGPYYVRIRPQHLSVKDVATGAMYEDVPVMAIQSKPQSILAVGSPALALAGRQNVRIANGFEHARTIIADFTVALETLKHFFAQVAQRSLIRPSPVVVMHVLERLEGGLTQVERRALRELALAAGAREVYLREGPELTDHEIKSMKPGGKE